MTSLSVLQPLDGQEREAVPEASARGPIDDANRVPDGKEENAERHRSAQSMLLARAEDEYRRVDRRLAALGPRLSMGPPWNMLLDLFISGVTSRKLSVTALCIGARTSTTTALRYLSSLQAAGLVERSSDTTDARRSYVQLTTAGWHEMCSLLDQ